MENITWDEFTKEIVKRIKSHLKYVRQEWDDGREQPFDEWLREIYEDGFFDSVFYD